MELNCPKNSIFCCADIDFFYGSFRKAAIDYKVVNFAHIDREASKDIIKYYIAKSVEQLINDCSGRGHWKDERNFLLYKLHYCCFLAWFSNIIGVSCSHEQSLSINTIFYVELVRILDFHTYMMQCLYELEEQTMVDMTKLLLNTINSERENESLVVQMTEYCLQKLCNVPQNVAVVEKSRKLLQLLTKRVQNVQVRLKIVEKITTRIRNTFFDFPKKGKQFETGEKTKLSQKYSKLFDIEQNIVQFDVAIQDFLNDKVPARITSSDHVKYAENSVSSTIMTENGTQSVEVRSMCDLICFLHQLVTCEWKTMFEWVTTEHGHYVIEYGRKLPHYHDLLVDIYIVGKLSLKYNKKDSQKLLDILEFYIEHQTTDEEKYNIEQIMQKYEIRSNKESVQDEEDGLNNKLDEAIFRIEENLLENEKSFYWLLRMEEFYFDEKWLECVVKHSHKFASITEGKLLLDVLCILYDTQQTRVYNTLKKVVLETISSLSIPEQIEVIIYNIQLTRAHFDSNEERSFFIPSNEQTILDETTAKLTIVMNKIVNKSDEKFHSHILLGICNAVLIAPYTTVKTLVNKAVVHSGCENIIWQILQIFQKVVSLKVRDDVAILMKVLDDIISNLSSTKEEEQFLKLVTTLLQPISYPDLELIEPALLSSSDVFSHIIKPKLRNTENNEVRVTFLLNILMKIMENSSTNEHHWILDEKPFEILFILLEMYEDCVHFWEDWTCMASNHDDDVMIRDDFALDQAWNEINIIVKILEERMIPLLTKDLVENSDIYQNEILLFDSQLRNCDWFISLLVVPLLQHGMMECAIKLPACMVNYIKAPQLNISPMNDEEYEVSFWTMFFKSGALSDEILGILLRNLKDNSSEKETSPIENIAEALSEVLPFSTLTQWQRLLTLTKQLLQLEYITLNETQISHQDIILPQLEATDLREIHAFSLLVSVFENLSTKLWITPYVWNIIMKSYISEMKRAFCIETKNYGVYCHLLVQLCRVAFTIVPEDFQENIIIVIFDILNKYLSSITGLDDQHFDHIDDQHFDHIGYLKFIIKIISQVGIRKTVINKIKQVFPNFDDMGTLC